MAVDPEVVDFGSPNQSYEETVLFMVANYQYLITCIAFSIAKPFRKQIWTNIPFFACIIFLFIFNGLVIFLPNSNKVPHAFNMLPFTTADGTSYYGYRYWITIGIVANMLLTYAAEMLIVSTLTRKADLQKQLKKEAAFHYKMQDYKDQVEK